MIRLKTKVKKASEKASRKKEKPPVKAGTPTTMWDRRPWEEADKVALEAYASGAKTAYSQYIGAALAIRHDTSAAIVDGTITVRDARRYAFARAAQFVLRRERPDVAATVNLRRPSGEHRDILTRVQTELSRLLNRGKMASAMKAIGVALNPERWPLRKLDALQTLWARQTADVKEQSKRLQALRALAKRHERDSLHAMEAVLATSRGKTTATTATTATSTGNKRGAKEAAPPTAQAFTFDILFNALRNGTFTPDQWRLVRELADRRLTPQ